jgi:hypothetical protein
MLFVEEQVLFAPDLSMMQGGIDHLAALFAIYLWH